MPAWNELTGLPRTLNSLAMQTEPPDLIIVADDGSQDGSIDNLQITYEVTWQTMGGHLVGHSQLQPNLYVLRKEHSGKADSINQALNIIHHLRPQDPEITAADIILILDADTRLLPNSIAAMRQTWLQYPHLTAIGGLLLPSCEGHSLITRLLTYYQKYEYARVHIWRLAWSHLHSSLIMSGACAAFRRDRLEAIGGFNSHSWVEDYEIMYRLHRHFQQKNQLCEVMIHPQVVVKTDAPADIGSWLRQRRRWSGGFLETMYLHREMVGQQRYGILGQVYLVHNALSIAMPFYGWLGLMAGTILWLNETPLLLENSSLISVIFVVRIALGLGITAMSLQLYRRHYHQRDLSYIGLIVSELLSFFFYGVLGSLSYLWGYLTFFRRQRHW